MHALQFNKQKRRWIHTLMYKLCSAYIHTHTFVCTYIHALTYNLTICHFLFSHKTIPSHIHTHTHTHTHTHKKHTKLISPKRGAILTSMLTRKIPKINDKGLLSQLINMMRVCVYVCMYVCIQASIPVLSNGRKSFGTRPNITRTTSIPSWWPFGQTGSVADFCFLMHVYVLFACVCVLWSDCLSRVLDCHVCLLVTCACLSRVLACHVCLLITCACLSRVLAYHVCLLLDSAYFSCVLDCYVC